MPHFTATTCGVTVNPDCADPDYRILHLGECPDDPRCADPVFAAANPTLCLYSPRLLIKPSAATVQVLGEVQYIAFLWINGAETELSEGVVWSVDDLAIAIMGAGSGNATGVVPGITTVRATYGGLTATARLEVIASCAARVNYFELLFDVSRSSSAVFAEFFGTRLDVAKSLGVEFSQQTNYSKDGTAVLSFDSTLAPLTGFSMTAGEVIDAIDGLSSTAAQTALGTMLQQANNYFASEGIPSTGRVIVLFSDGEHNAGATNPLTVAEAIKATGTILIVVGLRAKGTAFTLLQRMASGGFFINVLPSNVNEVGALLNGLREYLCSENCQPTGNVVVGVGALNYEGWTNWDVTDGEVDLCGRNPGGPPFYDLWPGNGLYMDDHGSGPDFIGEVKTKAEWIFEEPFTYRLTVWVAGNNRQSSNRSTRFRVDGPALASPYLDETIVRTYTQPFTESSWDFTIPAPGDNARLIINGLDNPGTEDAFGNWIGRVRLENLTTGEILIDDNFDDENLQIIPPGCDGYGGGGYGYYGYCPGQGCLDGTLPAQDPDPNPLMNMEGEANAAP